MEAAMRTKEEIHRLIQLADNARDKVYLLIMLDIHDSLVENTSVTRQLDSKVDGHIKTYTTTIENYSTMVAKSRGMWQATCFFLVVLQGIFGFEYMHIVNTMDTMITRIGRVEVQAEANRLMINDEIRRHEPQTR